MSGKQTMDSLFKSQRREGAAKRGEAKGKSGGAGTMSERFSSIRKGMNAKKTETGRKRNGGAAQTQRNGKKTGAHPLNRMAPAGATKRSSGPKGAGQRRNGPKKDARKKEPKKTVQDLDKEMDKYWDKDPAYAQSKMDNELDAYMQS